MVAARRASPLPLKVGPSSMEVANHILAMTAKINVMDEDVVSNSAQVLILSGQVSSLEKQSSAVLEQANKLTDAVRELREALLPGAAMRKELITLPNIIIEEVKHVLDENELANRRSKSIRARELKEEDTLARDRDLRNAKLAFYGLLAAGVAGELVRILLTHQM
jgi:hypothetical protein